MTNLINDYCNYFFEIIVCVSNSLGLSNNELFDIVYRKNMSNKTVLFDAVEKSKAHSSLDLTRISDRRLQKPTRYRYTTVYLARGVTKLKFNL